MSCKGLCVDLEKESIKGYDKGQRFCKMCDYYIGTKDLFCSCCNKMYRRKQRYRKIHD